MFCNNCGAKLADGSKFCSSCGANLSGGNSQHQNNNEPVSLEDLVRNYHNLSEGQRDDLWDVVIEAAFGEVFNRRQQFYKYGTNIYIEDKDPITREMQENIADYYMSGDEYEKPLLVFDYTGKGNLKEGFVITNRRFVFNYGGRGQQEFELRELKDIEVGKALLANVMYLLTVDGVKSDKIFLTGAGDEMGFATAFRKFVRMINEFYNHVYGNSQPARQSGKNSGSKRISPDDIARACHFVQFGFADDYELGNPVLNSSKKVETIKKNLQIPNGEDIFLIYNVTGFKKGLAICSSGVYFCGDSGRDYLDWEDFEDADIAVGFMNTSVSINHNDMSVGFAGKKLAAILEALQDLL